MIYSYYLEQNKRMNNFSYNLVFFAFSALLIVSISYIFLFVSISYISLLPKTSISPTTIVLDMPVIDSEPTPIQPINGNTLLTHQVQTGESLSTIFSKLNISKADLHHIINANDVGKQFASITPEKTLRITLNATGQLGKLAYPKNATDTLIAKRNNNTFDVKLVSKTTEKKIIPVQATINTSLFLDGKAVGLSDRLIMQLAKIFAWDIDFALNLRKGDNFTVIYEKFFIGDKEIDTGNILAAEFVNQEKVYTAVRFEDNKGVADYFTPEGKNMRQAFLRTPVDFSHISSHFNLRRKHPVLNRVRAHKGVDYAAKTGTAIKTTGDGKITFRGRKNGYGRVVIVQHGKKYSSLYAHMSSFQKGQRLGSHVKQGQIIGYVGKSGLATGPHLHYEFRINGVHKNPLTVKLPRSIRLKKSLLAQFKKQTQPLIAQLNVVKSKNLLVQNQF